MDERGEAALGALSRNVSASAERRAPERDAGIGARRGNATGRRSAISAGAG